MDGAHDRHVLQEFQHAALFGSGAVVELRGVNLRSQVEQDAHFALKRLDEFVFCKDHR